MLLMHSQECMLASQYIEAAHLTEANLTELSSENRPFTRPCVLFCDTQGEKNRLTPNSAHLNNSVCLRWVNLRVGSEISKRGKPDYMYYIYIVALKFTSKPGISI